MSRVLATETGPAAPPPPPKVFIINRIRTLRFGRAEMMQQDLADRTGMSRQTVNAIEGGKYSPSLEVAFVIAKGLDKPLDDVFQCVVTKA